MITLFIDTSTNILNIALIKDDILIKKTTLESGEHSKYVMVELEKLFVHEKIDPKSVGKIMVTNGPGSFTGIRIGVTIAKTYAWASNINVVPISTLKAYALSYDKHNYYVPVIDARRRYVYASIYDNNYNEVMNDSYISLDDLTEKIKDLSDALIISNDDISDLDTNSCNLDIQRIYDYYKDHEGINPHLLMPNYLKKTEAEEKLGG